MATLGPESESTGRGRDLTIAGILLLVALSTGYLPQSTQQRISATLHGTILGPFIATQERFEEARVGGAAADSLTSLVDSLSGVLSTHATLLDENRSLRRLLELRERAGPQFTSATVLRPGTPGSASMFMVDVGEDDGVRVGSPVVSPGGLVGVVREVRGSNAVAMDWTHPEFRASAMLADGSTYGMVENRPGRFREDDRLLLNGVAYNQNIDIGQMVVTSGFGGVYPRGIPIGIIDELRDEQGSWRRSYWLVPNVQPGAVTHVLVLTGRPDGDVLRVWMPGAALPADTLGPDGVWDGGAGDGVTDTTEAGSGPR